MLGESRRRIEKKTFRAPAKSANDRGPVGLHEERGGAAGRVVAGLALAFEHQHPAVRCQFISGRGARDTAAYDYEIVIVHHEHIKNRSALILHSGSLRSG